MMHDEVIEEIGDYRLERCDSFYAAYSGYSYIVIWEHHFSHKQLKGFRKDQLDEAKAHLQRVAMENRQGKRYNRVRREGQIKLKKGWLPVPWDDQPFYKQMVNRGYTVVEESKAYRWMAPPSPQKKIDQFQEKQVRK